MNPFIFPALIVLCVCSVLTAWIARTAESDRNGIGAVFAISVTASVWTIAACMLASIGLGATTRTGARGAIVTTVVSTVLVAYVIYRLRKESEEMRRKAWAAARISESVRAEE